MNRRRTAMHQRRKRLPLVILPALVLVGCTAAPAPSTTTHSSSASSPNIRAPITIPTPTPVTSSADTSPRDLGTTAMPSPSATPSAVPLDAAHRQLATMSRKEKIGQVLMVGVPATGSNSADLSIITRNALGNVFLKGRSSRGSAATGEVVERINTAIVKGTAAEITPYVATDQEGGNVQVLRGAGFSTLPTALVQGSWDATTLTHRATKWGKELAAVGINLNLAPVADTVSSASFAPSNGPIGQWKREYGYTPKAVSRASQAFTKGMGAAGVDSVIKHFPGLGRVTQNTDIVKNVIDTKTTRNDPYLEPFRAGIAAGNEWVMVSNSYYSKIDAKNIAPFSSTIMRGMLREDLGFTGVIISDDMCDATQLSPWGYATRAVRFFEAGGTMMLCVNAGKLDQISDALAEQAKKDPGFARLIDAAALKVLEAKQDEGS